MSLLARSTIFSITIIAAVSILFVSCNGVEFADSVEVKGAESSG